MSLAFFQSSYTKDTDLKVLKFCITEEPTAEIREKINLLAELTLQYINQLLKEMGVANKTHLAQKIDGDKMPQCKELQQIIATLESKYEKPFQITKHPMFYIVFSAPSDLLFPSYTFAELMNAFSFSGCEAIVSQKNEKDPLLLETSATSTLPWYGAANIGNCKAFFELTMTKKCIHKNKENAKWFIENGIVNQTQQEYADAPETIPGAINLIISRLLQSLPHRQERMLLCSIAADTTVKIDINDLQRLSRTLENYAIVCLKTPSAHITSEITQWPQGGATITLKLSTNPNVFNTTIYKNLRQCLAPVAQLLSTSNWGDFCSTEKYYQPPYELHLVTEKATNDTEYKEKVDQIRSLFLSLIQNHNHSNSPAKVTVNPGP